MNYWGLNAIFLAVVAVIGCLAIGRSRRLHQGNRAASVTAFTVVATVLVLLVSTAVFDNVMIAIGLVGYDPAKISGVFIGIAPLEDFAYALAAALLLPSLWVLCERRPLESATGAADDGERQ